MLRGRYPQGSSRSHLPPGWWKFSRSREQNRPRHLGFEGQNAEAPPLPIDWTLSQFGSVSHAPYRQALAGLSWLSYSPPGFPRSPELLDSDPSTSRQRSSPRRLALNAPSDRGHLLSNPTRRIRKMHLVARLVAAQALHVFHTTSAIPTPSIPARRVSRSPLPLDIRWTSGFMGSNQGIGPSRSR